MYNEYLRPLCHKFQNVFETVLVDAFPSRLPANYSNVVDGQCRNWGIHRHGGYIIIHGGYNWGIHNNTWFFYIQNTVSTKKWEQKSEHNEVITRIKEMYLRIHILSEEKEHLVAMLPGGILSRWICQKFSKNYNQECNEILRILWEVSLLQYRHNNIDYTTYFIYNQDLSEGARTKLYDQSRRDGVKMQSQKAAIEEEILELRQKVTALSISVNVCPEKQNCFESHIGKTIVGISSTFNCREIGCRKSFTLRTNLSRHQKTFHQWQLLSSIPSKLSPINEVLCPDN